MLCPRDAARGEATGRAGGPSTFHFVEDYERLLDDFLARYPIDEAMARAVGGAYEPIGQIEIDVLKRVGLRDGMTMLDMGCGSGRLAHALGKSGLRVDYTGVDIVQRMLDYAATKSPPQFRFLLNRALSVPAKTASLDLVSAFSLFTHLLHHETYIYLQDIHRVLKPGGRLVFSFLEFAAENQWPTFLNTVEATRNSTAPHLNSFIERSAIALWAEKLGFTVEGYIEPTEVVSAAGPLGQTTAILRRA
jgi:ubiquinone/menaquinone biosynthesis C-methylase UbiE